jgi:hypothetical protein
MLIAVVALVAGITGAWSPCGFSMVETLAPSGYAGTLRTTVIACTTFALGALAGALITFGGLSCLGAALGAAAPVAAAVIALAAAVGEARNLRIMPQVRRQVPESWRRVLPVPLAAGLYGVLLGLGFTTFILTFAVWALAGVAVALGDPQTGLAIGLGFGLGRTLPVIALAPLNGGRLHAAMAERPRILRGLRLLDAAALTALAATLAITPAHAAVTTIGTGFSDPVIDGGRLALHKPGSTAIIRAGDTIRGLPGNHPAVGADRIAWIDTNGITIEGLATIPAPQADGLAVSATYVAWRAGNNLNVAPLDPATGFPSRTVVTGNVGRPALSGNLLVYEIDGRIEAFDLGTGVHTLLRRQAQAELRGPSIYGSELAYVLATKSRQQVRIGPLTPRRPGSDEALYGTWPTNRRDAGHEPGRFPAKGHINKPLWERPPSGVDDTLTTTAATADAVYFTRLRKRRGLPITTAVLRVDRLPQD